MGFSRACVACWVSPVRSCPLVQQSEGCRRGLSEPQATVTVSQPLGSAVKSLSLKIILAKNVIKWKR